MNLTNSDSIEIRELSSTTRPLNILELCFSRSVGGLELYMANISRYLKERGHRVIAVASVGSYIADRIGQSGLILNEMDPKVRYLDVITALRLAAVIRKYQIEIIHVHQSADLSTAILAAKFARRGRTFFTQQMESRRRKKDPFHRWIYRNLDGLIAITQRIAIQARQYTPIADRKIHQLYYGIDLRKFFPSQILRESWREHYGIQSNEVAIGMVGRLEHGKGQHIFLRAAAKVQKKLPDLKFVIIGAETVGQTGYEAYLKSLVRELQIKHKVIFTGFVENVHELNNMLDVIVLATKKETFGLSLIEAMAVGAVPIGTNAGGVPEIIEHNKNGFLVPPEDADELAKAMFKLAGDPGKRERFARAARRTVEEKFNLEKHIEGLEKIFSVSLKAL